MYDYCVNYAFLIVKVLANLELPQWSRPDKFAVRQEPDLV